MHSTTTTAGEDVELADVMKVVLTLQRDIKRMSTRLDRLVSVRGDS
jgi:hypothetical protein